MLKGAVEKYQPVSGFHHKCLLFHLKLSAAQNVRAWGVYLGFSNLPEHLAVAATASASVVLWCHVRAPQI